MDYKLVLNIILEFFWWTMFSWICYLTDAWIFRVPKDDNIPWFQIPVHLIWPFLLFLLLYSSLEKKCSQGLCLAYIQLIDMWFGSSGFLPHLYWYISIVFYIEVQKHTSMEIYDAFWMYFPYIPALTLPLILIPIFVSCPWQSSVIHTYMYTYYL